MATGFKRIITNYDEEDVVILGLYALILQCQDKETVDSIKEKATVLLETIESKK